MPKPYKLDNATSDPEYQIVERAAQVQAKYRFYTSLVRSGLFFLFALVAVVIIADAIRDDKQQGLGADQSQILEYLTNALSGDASARDKLISGLQEKYINEVPRDKKISALAEYLTGPEEVTATVRTVKATRPAEARAAKSRVMLYSKPEDGADVLSSVNNPLTLQVLNRGEVWSEVTSLDGVPVWITRDGAKRYGIGYVKIEADASEIYSLPSKDGGEVLGALQHGEVARLIRTDQGWFRVWAPPSLSVWVKTEDIAGG